MHSNTYFLFLCIFCFVIICQTFPVGDERKTAQYLKQFGYIEDNSALGVELILSPDAISNALKDFQRFAGIKQTGRLDKDTITMMETPRCGVKDKIGHSSSTRKKRYALGSKWTITHLTYRISKYPKRLRNTLKVDNEIARAFKVWSDVTTLTFEERQRRGRVNIDIRFESKEHGDNVVFDGPGDTLAHAFLPQYGGDAHFDDEENWTINEVNGTNLFQVAAHEFGHSLGLLHSNEKHALMFPYDQGYIPQFKLHTDDVSGIQALYGSNERRLPQVNDEFSALLPDISDAPDLCQDASIDTITQTQDGNIHVFKGQFYWKILENSLAEGYPRRISDDWGGLEGNLDSSLTWPSGKTYFFKDELYWRFTNKKMDDGYPRLLSRGFEGIPDNIDAAFVWSGNGKSYFFKGDQYWRYDGNSDPPVHPKYPQPISKWNGLPNNIDASFRRGNRRTYFFKADKYYRFDDLSFKVESRDPPYPRPTSVFWFKCQPIPQN